MDGLDYYGMERRRLLAEGSCSSGLIGHRAAVNNDSGIAIAGETSIPSITAPFSTIAAVLSAATALEILLPVLCSHEPAEALSSFMWPQTVQNNAGCALLRLFSDSRVQAVRRPILPVFGRNDDRKERMVAGSVREALRRAEVLCAEDPTEARLALRSRLMSVDWQWSVEMPLFEVL